MSVDRIATIAAKTVQTQFQEDQRKFTQPSNPSGDEDKGGKILAQPAKGTKKQLVGTVVGIAALVAVLVLLKVFHII